MPVFFILLLHELSVDNFTMETFRGNFLILHNTESSPATFEILSELILKF